MKAVDMVNHILSRKPLTREEAEAELIGCKSMMHRGECKHAKEQVDREYALREALKSLPYEWTPDYKLPPDLHLLERLVDMGLAQRQEAEAFTLYRRVKVQP